MKHMADTVKKNLYRGVSGLLAAAVLLSGSGWVREVQARRRSVDDPTIRITFSEGEQPSALRYQAALAVHQQAEEEYEEALEAATLAAERLAAEKAAEELKNNVSNLETPENTGDSVGIQGGSGSGKNPSLNLQGGGLLDYEDRYVNLFEEETADPETTEPVTSKRTSRLLAYGEELIAIEGVLDRHGEVDEEVLIEVLGLEEALQEPVDSYSDTTGLVFDEVSTTAEPDISGCVSLPGSTFADTVSVKWNANDANYVDCETFFFDDLGTDGEIPETSWSYTFTGWHIVAAGNSYVPAETVFQPGDTVTPDVLEQYVSGGSLELEALWGKCYYIRNPYKTMVYTQLTPPNGLSYEFDADASSNPTGASDLNDGRTVDTAKATIDGLYRDFRANITAGTQDQGNAYETVVMLTGDLNLCLNGKTVTGFDGNRILASNGGHTLTISDCTAKTENGVYTAGKLTGAVHSAASNNSGGAIFVGNNDTLYLYDGILTGNRAYGGGGALNIGGTLYLYGGEISGNSAMNTGNGREGGAIYVNKTGKAFLLGGTICGNEARVGGGIYCLGTVLEIADTKIENNKATELAGGIFLADNTAVKLSGNVQILGNTAAEKASNLVLPDKLTLELGAMGEDARVALTASAFRYISGETAVGD